MIGCGCVLRQRCSVCRQTVDPSCVESARVNAGLFGAARYAMCVCCGQEVPRPWKAPYKVRWWEWAAQNAKDTQSAPAASSRLPQGFREGHSGDLACPHRDVSCCAPCAAAHEAIVEIGGQHFWIADAGERAEVAALEARRTARVS